MEITSFKGHRFRYQSKAYATSYTNLPPILHSFQVTADYVTFSLATGGRYTRWVIACEYRHKWYTAKTRLLKLFHSENVSVYLQPDAENSTIVSSFVWTQYRNVTEWQTGGQKSSGEYSGLLCEQCGRAVKIVNIDQETSEL